MNCIALVVVAFIAFASADYHGMDNNNQHGSCMSENEKIHQLEMQIQHLTQNNQALAAAGGMSAVNMLVGFMSGYAGRQNHHSQQQSHQQCGCEALEERIRVLEEHMMHVDEEHKATWSYEGDDGPENWYKVAEICNGERQSPIDLVPSLAVFNDSLGSFDRTWFDAAPAGMVLKNNGHALQVDLTDAYTIDESWGVLPGNYQAIQFHFHWARDEMGGSEHTVDGNFYYGELRIVHVNTAYPDVGTALSMGDGLAVLGFFVDIQGDDNPEFEKLLAPIKSGDVVYKDDNVVLNETFPLNDLMPNNLDNYWRYLGSLTTPPCSEAVVWTVFQDTLNISQAQADYLMNNLYHGYEEDQHNHFIQGNFRPVQPLNGRTVEASFN